MKKILSGIIIALMMAFGQSVIAKTVPVEAMTSFSATNPPDTMIVKVKSNIQVTDDIVLFENFLVRGKVAMQQNGAFAFIPYSYVNIHNEEAQFQPQTYGSFAGLLNNGQVVPAKAPLTINKGQFFVLNFKDIQKTDNSKVNNSLSGTPSEVLIDVFVPATEESQRPFSAELPGLPLTDLPTMDATNRYNPAMPLRSILEQREFLR
ncbi:TPA: hypothetical protein IAC10_14405 [Candidatus Scatousia excrementigallinarum]|uniref:Cohesin domain-containing protein n=1 Tax=Candidatus Scatousia excrementigallinarum TaxID=2840935 RepID=A0A9D1F2D1_9BACT|nr:hypothetical protein [Candidatus Scatousia excrementigallinarum]